MQLLCRIEPIINIQTGMRIGGELLCKPEGIEPEEFFQNIPQEIMLQIIQKQIFMLRANHHEPDRVLFLNATIPLLMNQAWLKSILSDLPGPKVIEIDCQQSEFYLSLLLSHINEIQTIMHDFNTQLWLDDLYVRHIPLISQLPFRFDGIKIDKHELWRISEEQNTSAMTRLVKQLEYLTDHVLVEGVENEYHHRFISDSNVSYAQGFLWPADTQESFVINL
ncbi:EAL domain-containing protein [Salmonella enterica]|nr:EAL domain-containing protein [Salmonella enterica]EDP9449846.1 EAL domain-containing protein [Salmonella enterica subsp. enterica]EHP7187559.1 EAL domain-containing protein [Salmonella enterica subsp. enterica serovar Thompson]EAS9367108.1 EAL domain-containing protein [Salmonella enterica]EBO9513484.1 EAL domain-containing protein [Salmonella enterica]